MNIFTIFSDTQPQPPKQAPLVAACNSALSPKDSKRNKKKKKKTKKTKSKETKRESKENVDVDDSMTMDQPAATKGAPSSRSRDDTPTRKNSCRTAKKSSKENGADANKRKKPKKKSSTKSKGDGKNKKGSRTKTKTKAKAKTNQSKNSKKDNQRTKPRSLSTIEDERTIDSDGDGAEQPIMPLRHAPFATIWNQI